ncbi:MAG: hypothetical protein WBH31_07375 [Promethearchaeia archaeon]
MEQFIPDGSNSQEVCISKLKENDVVIFLISSYYGSLMESCSLKEDCKAVYPMKNIPIIRHIIDPYHKKNKLSLVIPTLASIPSEFLFKISNDIRRGDLKSFLGQILKFNENN